MCTILFIYIYLYLFFTCFGHPSAHRQEKSTVSMRHCYSSLWMGGVWSAGWIEIQFRENCAPSWIICEIVGGYTVKKNMK